MTQISDLLAQITGEPSPILPTTNIPPKRKADDDLRRSIDKVPKTGPPAANSSRPMIQTSRSSAVDSSMSKMKIDSNGHRPSIPNSATSTFKNGQPTPPPSNDAPKPPKKGSYAEIMARGKAAQATLGQVGKIQHKRIEKPLSKRELEQIKAQKSQKLQKVLGPKGKFRSGDQPPLKDERNGTRENNGKAIAAPVPEKKIKKAALATTGYAGTARPKPGASKGPSRPSASGSSRYERDRYANNRRGSSGHYRYASDEEEEEQEEEGEEYDSDVSSDMEAAVFEVDEEEELAARIARKEDAEALAEENRLKREKEEKKRRLAAMAAKAKARY
jgi:protein SPT2